VCTETKEQADRVIRFSLTRGCSLLGLAGGDGTVNVALGALSDRDVPVALVPLGTANDLATALAARPRGTHLAEERRVDVLAVNDRPFCTTGGLGSPADVVVRLDRLRTRSPLRRPLALLGRSIYPLCALENTLSGRTAPAHREIRYLGVDRRWREVSATGYGLFVSNQSTVGHRLAVQPHARHDDGVFEIGLLRARTPGGLLIQLQRMRLGRPAEGLMTIAAIAATIRCDVDGWFFGDGEPLVYGRRFDLTIRPGALRVVGRGALAAARSRGEATAPSSPAGEERW
jgi:diacylglycerol kinase family enzyme